MDGLGQLDRIKEQIQMGEPVPTEPLELLGCDSRFFTGAMAAVEELPIVGEECASRVIALAHYSVNPDIASFRKTSTFSWTSRISEIPNAVALLTGLHGVTFRALYVIRYGINSHTANGYHDSGHMRELAIRIAVRPGHFARLKLGLDANTGAYYLV